MLSAEAHRHEEPAAKVGQKRGHRQKDQEPGHRLMTVTRLLVFPRRMGDLNPRGLLTQHAFQACAIGR
jgi:hypothetical protein